ncbi:MAG: YHYH protein [Verrucomicrobiales bacterium]|nr:YHYH protein [Verrucomicrobiales bacterium]
MHTFSSRVGLLVIGGLTMVASFSLWAQPPGPPPGGGRGPGGGPPPSRVHTATESEELDLVPANRTPPETTEVSISEKGDEKQIVSNGMPNHKVGRFPNRANPNEIREQSYDIVIPENPEVSDRTTSTIENPGGGGRPPRLRVFGITLDGVLLEPGTAEFWQGKRDSGWNYEALGGAIPLGLDENYGHVQPNGSYHYHGLPIGLMRRLGHREGEHSPQIGWAADGFPIYALYGFRDPEDPDSGVVELGTSYRLRSGERPGGEFPTGEFDGAFVQDYEFVEGFGDLDECNGRFCVTPEFPDGTYAYFLTREWPVVPRVFRGTPVEIVKPGAGRGMGPGRGHPPGRGGPPPR